jgi:hypothetical protein
MSDINPSKQESNVCAMLAAIDNLEAWDKLSRLLRAVLQNQSGSEEVLVSRSVITRTQFHSAQVLISIQQTIFD